MAIGRNRTPEPYSSTYKRVAFHVWYSHGRTSMTKLQHLLEPREDGTSPNEITLGKWRKADNWEERADEMDEEAAVQIQKKLIDDKVKILEEHAKLGKKLRLKAVDLIEGDDISFEKPHEAMRLLEIATGLEADSVGLSGILQNIRDMDDAEVKDKLSRLLKKGRLDEINLIDEGEKSDG